MRENIRVKSNNDLISVSLVFSGIRWQIVHRWHYHLGRCLRRRRRQGGADELDFISVDVALGAAIHHTDGKDEGILRIVHAAR